MKKILTTIIVIVLLTMVACSKPAASDDKSPTPDAVDNANDGLGAIDDSSPDDLGTEEIDGLDSDLGILDDW